MDYRIQPLHQFLIIATKFAESLGLRLKYGRDGLGGMTALEHRGKGMGV
jgi:hypothetical protein